MKTLFRLFWLFALVCCTSVALTQTDHAALIERLKVYRFGGDPAVLDAVSAWVQESRAQPDRRRQAARELASVLPSDAAFDAKQFVCRQLTLIAGEEEVGALAGLLHDESLADYALMALVRIPSKAVNAALRRELPRVLGRAQIAIIDTLGERRDTAAVPILTNLLRSRDPMTVNAAAAALGKIAEPRGIQALRQAYARSSGDRRLTLGDALLEGAFRLLRGGDAGAALDIFALLDRSPATPTQRAAALRGIVEVRGTRALPLLLKALGEDDTPRQYAAARLARELPGRAVTVRLSQALPKLTPVGKRLLLAALGDRADPSAAAGVLAMCRDADVSVRMTALRALGALGGSESVSLLLRTAATGSTQEREAARASLARLRGQAVDVKLIEALERAAPPLRIEAVLSLGQRRAVGALPNLLDTARNQTGALRTAAVRVLQEMGRHEHLPALLDLLLSLPSGERDEVMSAVTEVARRGANEEERTGPLLSRLTTASSTADRVDLLTLLGQIGGKKALEVLRQAGADPSSEIQQCALSLLAEWPTDEPMEDLLRTVRSSPDSRLRRIALRGYIRMVGMDEERPPDRALALYREVETLARDPEEKRLILSGLARLRLLAALEYAAGFLQDESLRAEAEIAVLEIGRSTVGAWRDRTREIIEPIAQGSTNESTRSRAREILALAEKFGDFVTAWEVSPAYHQDGADCLRLFDIPFPPEEPEREKQVPWRLMPAGTNPEQPWLLDLLALWGGEQRVAYLRTAVWSPADGEVILELGSDDGVKVWWNGQVVHANNTRRPVAPAQEKVKLQVKSGWNHLLLKITQNNLGWGACARFTNPDGSPAAHLRYRVPSRIEG